MRGFFGGFSGGGSGSGKDDKKTYDRIGKSKAGKYKKQNYDDFMDEQMQHYKKQMMAEVKMNQCGVVLPGTDPNQKMELTDTAKKALEMLAERQARKHKKTISFTPKNFGGRYNGGRIDKKGNVYDAAGKVAFKVNTKTGEIVDNYGRKVGKYDEDSSYSKYRMEKLLEKANAPKKPFGK